MGNADSEKQQSPLAKRLIFSPPKMLFLIGRYHPFMYGTLEVLGPEHEFSIVDEKLTPLSIVDKVIKDIHGRVVNCVPLGKCAFGKELQAHVAEFKAIKPFSSPEAFEETVQEAVDTILRRIEGRYKARLLGLGMHPSLRLDEARIWPHRDRQIYNALSGIFDLKQHGWLNIQSYQLNLPYKNEREAVRLYNALANVLPYLPAVAASSPIYESRIGEHVDNRLHFYSTSQREVPSITGDIIPEYIGSFQEYEKTTINKYSEDLAKLNASRLLLNKEWINSRGAVIRFDRKAIEIRIMDEQECVKSDVSLSCFIRSSLWGIISNEKYPHLAHETLVKNLDHVVKDGLAARVEHPEGKTAKDVCNHLLKTASDNATSEEKKYLSVVKRRIENGNLSNLILRDVNKKLQKTDMEEAILSVYSKLADCLEKNQIYV